MSDVSDALERLGRYRRKLRDDAMIDEEMGLSVQDLDILITIVGSAALDPGVASELSADDVADEMPHREDIMPARAERAPSAKPD